MERGRYKVIIEKIVRESHEVILEGDNIMDALDEARRMVEQRNSKFKDKYYVTKITEEEIESK